MQMACTKPETGGQKQGDKIANQSDMSIPGAVLRKRFQQV